MANMMQKMVDGQRCQVMMSPVSCVQGTEMLQVEIDIIGGAVASGRRNKKGGVIWRQRVEDGLWLASACFILFYGDFRSNFFCLLAFDSRIRRAPLVYGVACLLLDCFLFPALLHSPAKKDSHAASAIVACLAVAAFVMLSMALWPVWYVLTIPLLFTLLMALLVLISYIASCSAKPQ